VGCARTDDRANLRNGDDAVSAVDPSCGRVPDNDRPGDRRVGLARLCPRPRCTERLVIGAISLHGVGFALFCTAIFIFADSMRRRTIKASAQGFLASVTFGLGCCRVVCWRGPCFQRRWRELATGLPDAGHPVCVCCCVPDRLREKQQRRSRRRSGATVSSKPLPLPSSPRQPAAQAALSGRKRTARARRAGAGPRCSFLLTPFHPRREGIRRWRGYELLQDRREVLRQEVGERTHEGILYLHRATGLQQSPAGRYPSHQLRMTDASNCVS